MWASGPSTPNEDQIAERGARLATRFRVPGSRRRVPGVSLEMFANPGANVAYDAALFEALEATGTGETLRLWESPNPAVIVGHSTVIARDVHEAACAADGVPLIRRTSGGGSVVVGPGCLNYVLALSLDRRPELRDVARSYQIILAPLVRRLGLRGLRIAGVGDLVLNGRKVSGSAQRRGRRSLLHHGTFLYNFDLSLIARYLREPARQPAYRAGRSHLAFVANAPIAAEVFQAHLASVWSGGPSADARIRTARALRRALIPPEAAHIAETNLGART
jgi:lipoate-protein ligase A